METAYSDSRVAIELTDVKPFGAPPYTHHVVRLPRDSVAAVVHDPGSSRVLLLYHHRFITDSVGLAVPAGGIGEGESALAAARREVLEETGVEMRETRLLLSTFVLPAVTKKKFFIVYGVSGGQIAEPVDAFESTRLYWVPTNELVNLMRAGLMSAQPSMLALLYAERLGLFDQGGIDDH